MRIAAISFIVTMLFGSSPLMAAAPGAAEPLSGSIDVTVVFTDEEIRIIRAHYESRIGRNGNGRQKGLPPGIRKNLARGKPLPPGIAKRALPYDLQRALPPVKDGHERVIVAGKILLIEIATQVVRDVLSDVLLD